MGRLKFRFTSQEAKARINRAFAAKKKRRLALFAGVNADFIKLNSIELRANIPLTANSAAGISRQLEARINAGAYSGAAREVLQEDYKRLLIKAANRYGAKYWELLKAFNEGGRELMPMDDLLIAIGNIKFVMREKTFNRF